jgi:phage shock protein A
MKQFIITEILDRYQKAIQEATYYRQRIERHEQQVRAANRENQQLKVNINLLQEQLDEFKKTEQCTKK